MRTTDETQLIPLKPEPRRTVNQGPASCRLTETEAPVSFPVTMVTQHHGQMEDKQHRDRWRFLPEQQRSERRRAAGGRETPCCRQTADAALTGKAGVGADAVTAEGGAMKELEKRGEGEEHILWVKTTRLKMKTLN